jgi:hypothetical protein
MRDLIPVTRMACAADVIDRRITTTRAARFVRKMRGGSQPHLIQAEDGNCYVVKFKDNPQHRRVLVNEWIATGLMQHMSIATPGCALIEVTEEFLSANPGVYISRPTGHSTPSLGAHFGSRFPGDPETAVVHDVLPSVCLKNLQNASDFVGALVLDLWLSNNDTRQAIFSRTAGNGRPSRYSAFMIDNGYCFNGPRWELKTSKLAPLYFDTGVYEPCWFEDVVALWLAKLNRIPETAVRELADSVPEEWLEGDREALDGLIEQLILRRGIVADLLENVVTLGLLSPRTIRRMPVGKETGLSRSAFRETVLVG